jgi:hypothetical protein
MQVDNRHEPITTARRTDAELELYFGGRAAYLASCAAELSKAEAATYSPTYAADDIFASTFALFVSPDEDRANWEQHKAYKIAIYQGAIEANQ